MSAATTTYEIEWDMGTYGPFATREDARAFQRQHRMTGSSVVVAEDVPPACPHCLDRYADCGPGHRNHQYA